MTVPVTTPLYVPESAIAPDAAGLVATGVAVLVTTGFATGFFVE
ncbi:unannotated protein [freshwater metagenome]|uniref:Unannotated protein n=1 Tax=freshwater metagenome TaxID=449393 RepID=A0A6J6QKA2_9ZZZZ